MSSLQNKVIISTRPQLEDDTIKQLFTEKGAEVLSFPMIEIDEIELSHETESVLKDINSFQWLVFTSKNGVKFFFKNLSNLGISIESLATVKIAVVGKITAKEVLKYNVNCFYVSSGNTSQDLLAELLPQVQSHEKILLSLAELADDTLEQGFVDRANATRINVYRTLQPNFYSNVILDQIIADNYDVILFTSPSGVQNFMKIVNERGPNVSLRAVSIGTTTEKELLKNNICPLLVSSRTNASYLAQELENYFKF